MSEVITKPSFPDLVRTFLRIGLLSFGGPAGQIALMHRVLVDEKRWIDEPRFLNGLNFCMLLPGPEAMQLATYIGWLLHGVRGGLVAGALFVLPGFFVILGLSMIYVLFQGAPWFTGVFFGLKAAVLAVVIEALIRVARRSLKTTTAYWLAGLSFLALFAFRVPFPLVVLAAGAIGYGLERAGPAVPGFQARPAAEAAPGAAAGGSIRMLLVWGGLWAAAFAVVLLLFGANSVYLSMAGFFSKMAVVTFGGAYAVLAYVAQAAVDTFGWLKPGEMIDGLALAETTPGPLILVLTFVGFLAAYRDPGGLSPLAGGIFGAVLTTWVTFVPCFLWIFLGAPYIERLRQSRALSGALAAIGAAVVGVILNLTLWFSLQTLFARVGTVRAGWLAMPLPEWTSLDPLALVLAVLAALLLLVMRIGLATTLAGTAFLGFIAKMAF